MATMAVGAYQTACEASINKQQIDTWLNEGKACEWISRELKTRFNESISGKSVAKYKQYRDSFIQKEIEKSPEYQGKVKEMTEQFNDGVAKIQKIDVLGTLSKVVEDSAEMLAEAKENQVAIRNAQDWRYVSQTLLDAVKLYGDTMLKAQRFGAIENDPSLLKPTTINVNVKTALTDILKEVATGGGYGLIDKLRATSKSSHDTTVIEADFKEMGGDDNG